MTMRPFGRVTPAQMYMLQLAGYTIDYSKRHIKLSQSDEECKKCMRQGYISLCQLIGKNFGYDLAAWHEALKAEKESGYTHPYAFRSVSAAIQKAMGSARRRGLVEQVEQESA
jgi:hypothetical protein